LLSYPLLGLNGEGLKSKGFLPGGGGGLQTLASQLKIPNTAIYMATNSENCTLFIFQRN